MSKLSLRIIEDSNQIRAIYNDSYINNKISYEGRTDFYIDSQFVKYLGCFVDDLLIGCFMCIDHTDYEVEIHIAILKKYLRYARAFSIYCLYEVFKNPTVLRATAYVLEGLESTKNLCLKLGFVEEGKRREVCIKDGQTKCVYVLGILRKELKWDLSAKP